MKKTIGLFLGATRQAYIAQAAFSAASGNFPCVRMPIWRLSQEEKERLALDLSSVSYYNARQI